MRVAIYGILIAIAVSVIIVGLVGYGMISKGRLIAEDCAQWGAFRADGGTYWCRRLKDEAKS